MSCRLQQYTNKGNEYRLEHFFDSPLQTTKFSKELRSSHRFEFILNTDLSQKKLDLSLWQLTDSDHSKLEPIEFETKATLVNEYLSNRNIGRNMLTMKQQISLKSTKQITKGIEILEEQNQRQFIKPMKTDAKFEFDQKGNGDSGSIVIPLALDYN